MKNIAKQIVCLSIVIGCAVVQAGSYDDFFRAIKGDDAGAVSQLLQRGFDPNTRDPHGQTGLLTALREPSPKVIKVLLESPKTDVDAVDEKDESPLMLAALKGLKVEVNALLKRDAAVNKTGWAPLHYAATSGQLDIMRLLLENHAFIDAQSPNGTTPLMMAAMYGSTAAVKLLLDEGADPLMKNEKGLSAADFAQRANQNEAVALIAGAMRGKQGTNDGKW
ncbi:MAG: ankyrin repeat-containing protein [Variovorax sp.]|nr:ankyrin repeat-containing protein [Variovorax sp.]